MPFEKIIIPDSRKLATDSFTLPDKYDGTVGSVLIPYPEIFTQTSYLAEHIDTEYAKRDLHVLCVLDGADMFCTDLMKHFHDYYRTKMRSVSRHDHKVSSYQGTQSTGKVTISGEFSWVKGSDILVVEDIIDTGLTMKNLRQRLEQDGAQSVKVASLLEKRLAQGSAFKADYVGFSIPDEFVVGFGLDYNNKYRDLLHIGIINEEGIRKFA